MTASTFDRHAAFLKEHFEIVTLDALLEDGYAAGRRPVLGHYHVRRRLARQLRPRVPDPSPTQYSRHHLPRDGFHWYETSLHAKRARVFADQRELGGTEAGVILSDYATLMVEILKDNVRWLAGFTVPSTCRGLC